MRNLVILLACCFLFSCKKKDNAPNFTVLQVLDSFSIQAEKKYEVGYSTHDTVIFHSDGSVSEKNNDTFINYKIIASSQSLNVPGGGHVLELQLKTEPAYYSFYSDRTKGLAFFTDVYGGVKSTPPYKTLSSSYSYIYFY